MGSSIFDMSKGGWSQKELKGSCPAGGTRPRKPCLPSACTFSGRYLLSIPPSQTRRQSSSRGTEVIG